MALKRYGARDADLKPLLGQTVAVLGYGSQGSAQAKNLRDSGCKVLVGQRLGSPRHETAVADGFAPVPIRDAVRGADLVVLALPDDQVGKIYRDELAGVVRPGQALGFIHGFAIHYKLVQPPLDVDVVLVAPKAQGAGVRSLFVAGRGPAALLAVHQNATGRALQTALAWAAGIGAGRAGILETTFKDETETDLFGEQAVLCGGLSALITAAFETLVEAGYPPELAYFECCHEVKLLADLIHTGGITAMRERISSTARFGDLTRGPRIIDAAVGAHMREVLAEIQSGRFAAEFLRDAEAGGQRAIAELEKGARHPIEAIGRDMRGLAFGSQAD
jgi:ketol-acid reductoisomerase